MSEYINEKGFHLGVRQLSIVNDSGDTLYTLNDDGVSSATAIPRTQAEVYAGIAEYDGTAVAGDALSKSSSRKCYEIWR